MEEVKELLKKATRKRTHDVLMAEKYKLEIEIKNQPPPKLKEDTVEEEKPPAVGYTVKINSYGRIALPTPLPAELSVTGVPLGHTEVT